MEKIAPGLDHLSVPIDSVVPDPENARRHGRRNMEAIKQSLERFGQRLPIVVQKQGRVIRAGNGRWLGAKELGWQRIAVLEVDEGDMDAIAYALADNQTAELAEWDDEVLSQLLVRLQTHSPELATYSGFTQDEIAKVMAELGGGAVAEVDQAPPLPKQPITKPGDVWELGDHVLVCGDATNADDIRRSLGEEMAAMIFTDPPWNVNIAGGTHDPRSPNYRSGQTIENDNLGDSFGGFIQEWAHACLPQLDGDLYCVMGSGEWPTIDGVLREAGMHWSATLIWVKDSFVFSRRQYHPRFEPIWYGWPKGKPSSYCGSRDQDDVWTFDRPKVSEEHPTMKPVGLVEKAILNSSERGDLVLDPFMGSGTTLLAAHRQGRRCAGLELDPKYCDVIVERWQDLAGSKATRRTQP